MKIVAVFGVVLIIIGIIGLVHGGITYTAKQTTVQVGPFAVTAQEKRTVPISTLAGGVLVAGGIILLVLGGGTKR